MSDEIVDGQQQLAAALHRARAGEDRELGQRVRELGEQFVRLTNALVRLCKVHAPDNDAFNEPTRQLVNAMKNLDKLIGQVSIVCVEGQVYVNDIRVRMDERLSGPAELESDLGRHGCGGLTFVKPIEDEQVRALTACISSAPAEEKPLHAFLQSLRDAGVENVNPSGKYRLRLTGETARTGTELDLHQTLERASGVVSEAWDSLAANRVPNPLPIRRMVNELVDASEGQDILGEENQAIERGAGTDEFARHSIRVTTFAVLIGRELGLPSGALADLGVAAMYHDAGYAQRDDAGYAAPFSHHGTAGARALGRQRGFHQAKIKRMLVALEHHRDLERRPSLYARIIRIADDFENYTRVRSTGQLVSPAEALARMASACGTAYDPVLFQIFVNTVGAFPPGTLLKLRDGRLVVVTSGVRSAESFAKPMCRVLKNADLSEAENEVVDLAASDAQIAEVLLHRR